MEETSYAVMLAIFMGELRKVTTYQTAYLSSNSQRFTCVLLLLLFLFDDATFIYLAPCAFFSSPDNWPPWNVPRFVGRLGEEKRLWPHNYDYDCNMTVLGCRIYIGIVQSDVTGRN